MVRVPVHSFVVTVSSTLPYVGDSEDRLRCVSVSVRDTAEGTTLGVNGGGVGHRRETSGVYERSDGTG